MRKDKKKLEIFMTLLILVCSFYIGRFSAAIQATGGGGVRSEAGTVVTENMGVKVVVDAGHGGADAGKVGINGALEKDINLLIAGKLKALLEAEGIEVLMTRTGDGGLYDEGEPNKKQQDMKRRCTLINESQALLAVSIHQNSYTQESVNGPQVFYYETSPQGQTLARILQESLNTTLKVERPREIKPNDSYYLLRETQIPTVIAECGFLSNAQEAEKLSSDAYQEKVAKAVCDGVLAYIEDAL